MFLLYLYYFFLTTGYASAQNKDIFKKSILKEIALLKKKNKGVKVSIGIYDLQKNRPLFFYKILDYRKPASLLKLVTSYVAYQRLGADYRFKTKVFWSKSNKILTIVGGGDPLFTTEDIWLLAQEIKARGIRQVNKLTLNSAFVLNLPPSRGFKAYQAGGSAIALNYNSVKFLLCINNKTADITLLPLGSKINFVNHLELGNKDNLFITYNQGRYFIQGILNKKIKKCREYYRAVPNPGHYYRDVLSSYLNYLNVDVKNAIIEQNSRIIKGKLLFEYQSKPLDIALRYMNRYSSNFIANQVTAHIGLIRRGRFMLFDFKEGIKEIKKFVSKITAGKDYTRIEDASGLSHNNRIQPAVILTVLNKIYYNFNSKIDLLHTLAVPGREGTLEDKGFLDKIRAKTGTLTGVRGLAGFVYSQDKNIYSFVLLLNGLKSKEEGMKFEDKILNIFFNH